MRTTKWNVALQTGLDLEHPSDRTEWISTVDMIGWVKCGGLWGNSAGKWRTLDHQTACGLQPQPDLVLEDDTLTRLPWVFSLSVSSFSS